MNQMGIAVVNNVKQIELLSLARKPLGISHKTIQCPLCGIGRLERSRGNAGKVSFICRTEACSGKAGSLPFAEMAQQHVSDKVHAGPVLLKQIADNGDARQF